MKNADRFISALSLLLILVLLVYATATSPYILRKDTSIAKLEKNSNYYEGKEIILSIIPIGQVKEKSIIITDWNKKSRVEVLLSDAPGEELKSGAIVTVAGISYLETKGYIGAREVHVHENYFLRMYISPIGLAFLLFLMHRERIIRRIYA